MSKESKSYQLNPTENATVSQHDTLQTSENVQLVASYLGELYAYKAIHCSKREGGPPIIHAASLYAHLPEYLQRHFDTARSELPPVIGIDEAIAISFAKKGDKTRIEQLIKKEEANRKEGEKEEKNISHHFKKILYYSTECLEHCLELAGLDHIYEKLDFIEEFIKHNVSHGLDTTSLLDEYNRVRLSDPDRPNSIYTLDYAKLLMLVGRSNEALTIIQNEFKDDDSYAREHLVVNLIESLLKQNRIQEAITLLKSTDRIIYDLPIEQLTNAIAIRDKKDNNTLLLIDIHNELINQQIKRGGINWRLLKNKAEIDIIMDKDISEHIKDMRKTIASEDQYNKIRIMQSILSLSYRAGLEYNTHLNAVISEIFEFARTADYKDKIEPAEALYSYEDTIDLLIELQLFDDAIKLIDKYEKTFPLDEKGQPITEIDYVQKAYINISLQYFAIAEGSTQHTLSLTEEVLHKASGYSSLSIYEAFTPAQKAFQDFGKRERQIIEGQIIEPLSDDFIPYISHFNFKPTIDESIFTLFTNVLREESTRGEVSPSTRRIIKHMLDAGDTSVYDLAVSLFLDQSQPLHFRTYLAKKLCDEGYWDRQILFYFKEYRNTADQTPPIDQKLETLETIITQMHQKPNIQMYKLLETTRQEKDSETMVEIARLGAEILLIEDLDLNDRMNIFAKWANYQLDGSVRNRDIKNLTTSIRKLGKAWVAYKNIHTQYDRTNNIRKSSQEILSSPSIVSGLEESERLLYAGIFPTARLIRYVQATGGEGLTHLSQLQDLTQNGAFEYDNSLQRDLEFTSFIKQANQDKLETLLDTFLFLPKNEQESRSHELTYVEKFEAKAAAYEAARLYWFIHGLVEKGREVVLVGNKRYGAFFVTQPLERYISHFGIKTRDIYVHSSNANENILPELPDSFISLIATKTPDILIVDGSPRRNQHMHRLPNSFVALKKWFETFNDATNKDQTIFSATTNSNLERIASFHPKQPYTISFWTPDEEEKIELGNTVMQKNTSDGAPTVFFINSVIHPAYTETYPREFEKHIPGYFDDPDTKTQGRKQFAFTRFGVQNIADEKLDQEEYIRQVQNEIEKHIPRFINATDPTYATSREKEYPSSYLFS